MIATITLNPCLDKHIMVPGLMVEEANRWVRVHEYAAGKGIDVSRAIHEMEGMTTAYGFIGGDDGHALEILLDEEGVLFSFTPISQETRTNFIITDTKNFQQTRIDAPGPRISKKELVRFFRKLRQIRPKPDLIVASGSVPPGLPVSIYYDIVTEARDLGVRAALDSHGKWLEEGIRAKPYLIKPNVHEAEELLKTELPTEEAIVQAALDLIEMGVGVAVISRGKNGIIGATKESVVKAVPPAVKVRSAVGAGDCTMAGLTLKLVSKEPLREACRLGVAMGTACVLTPGTTLCRKADVERLLPKIRVWEMPVKPGSKISFPADD